MTEPHDIAAIWNSTNHDSPDIVWRPTPEYVEQSRLWHFMQRYRLSTFAGLLAHATDDVEWYWDAVVKDLELQWFRPYEKVLDLHGGVEWPRWFVGGLYNYVCDAVDRQASTHPGQIAIAWEGEDGEIRTLPYAGLRMEVCKAANALKSLGVRKGDRVGLFMPMIPETAVAALAISWIGAIYIPIFSGYGGPAVASRLSDCDAKVLITADGFYRGGKIVPMKETADEAAAGTPGLEKVIVVRRLDRDTSWTEGRDLWWHEVVDGQDADCHIEQTAAEDPYMIVYTSGTTGKPKGVVHVQGGFPIKAAQELAHCFDLHAGDNLFWISDIGWMMGPWAITGALMLGATCFLYEGSIGHPDPGRVWQIVERHRITHLGISPTAVRALMTNGDRWPNSYNLDTLRVLAGAGEPWNPGPWRWLFEVVGGSRLPVINYSGGTEVSGGILSCNPLLPLKPCAFSAPVPGMAAAVLNPEGQPVRGEVGELALCTPWPGIARGFWRDPGRYLDTYWSRLPGTWVHGDWARVDEDGFWFILGRSDDTIKLAGKRVGPAEVESAAVSHPAVAEAVAIGVPDDVKGESLVLFVILRPGSTPDEALRTEIESTVVHHLGKSLRPGQIRFVSDVPRTRNGKILRRLVRRSYLGEPLGDISSLENPASLDTISSSR